MKTRKGSITTAAYQDAALKKDGTQTIYLRLTIDRKVKAFPTGIAVPAKHWDKARQQVKLNVSGLPNARETAAKLSAQKAALDKVILDLQARGEAVTFASVERRMSGGSRTRLLDYCAWRRDCEAPRLAKGTVVNHNASMASLRRYDPDTVMADITPRWLEGYQEWLFACGKHKNNTIVGKMVYLRKILGHAALHGDIPSNPFARFKKASPQAVEKQYLTREELARLAGMYHGGAFRTANLPAKHAKGAADCLHHCLQRFLASCFSGLRFSDIAGLKPGDLQGGHLNIVVKKTGAPLRIPLNAPLRSVLDLSGGAAGVFGGRGFTNAHTNARLAQVMELAGITKHITFHSGRHTFAIMALEVGMPIEVVSHILGHADLSTTQVYARVVDKQKAREMARMDTLMAGVEIVEAARPG